MQAGRKIPRGTAAIWEFTLRHRDGSSVSRDAEVRLSLFDANGVKRLDRVRLRWCERSLYLFRFEFQVDDDDPLGPWQAEIAVTEAGRCIRLPRRIVFVVV
ncbi:MAG TPA: hypothetical protein VJ718_02010 [Candidatus Binataceae bacterium]|nr:hypothetical protein [Candidatus Binataceae bacterium]